MIFAAKEAAGMALSDDLRQRVVRAVVDGGMSRNAAAERFGVSVASAARWAARFTATGWISPDPVGGDRRSHRIEAHRDYLLGLIRRQPDLTLLEIEERLIANCGEHFSSSMTPAIWVSEGAVDSCLGVGTSMNASLGRWPRLQAIRR